ncbi:partitioning defective 3 homolog B isoform X3 [Xenopus laevis]|uniref:Partitioning defective 3 homolog B n=1 Tax=Xenopus laevis TaxID=8355 RepID=A0A8J1LU83_XENLA|nr:partitioning defective 3 homolog B isoform X3 [Xenopus laevis]
MKVTVCFGKTAIVVPCKDGKMSVRDLIQQAAQRFIKAKEKEPGYWVKVHHLEYQDGGILDPDDVLADVVEDKDKIIAVFDEHEAPNTNEDAANVIDHSSPDPFEAELSAQRSAFQPLRGEIDVTSSALKIGTPLLVRRSSDPTVGPAEFHPSSSAEQNVTDSAQGLCRVLAPDEQKDLNWQEEHPGLQKPPYKMREITRKVEISGSGGPLGIHVVPFYSSLSGRALGLYIRGIEESSRSKREGLFQENECIVKINNVELIDRSFAQAQDIFRQAMKQQNVLVKTVLPENRDLYEKSVISSLYLLDDDIDEVPDIKPPPPPTVNRNVKMAEQINGVESTGAKKLHPPLSPNQISTGSTFSSPSLSPLGFGNKKNAKKTRIDLTKGAEGLGFTVVTRDSTVHGPGPIFVKNILPKGAAVKDGRLLSGDRILEVNGKDIAGKTQEELVAMLRSTKLGESVSLVVARQDETFLPRELKGETENLVFPPDNTAQMTFEIPLNDTGSAGLGISLKGNKSRETGADLGIFIKSIIHGGAAFKDGRLRVNDQLVAVNGESLLGKSNREAMETLRRSMSMEGNIRGMIQLVILRRLDWQMEERLETVQRNTTDNLAISEQNGVQEKLKDSLRFNDQNSENEIPPPIPPYPKEHIIVESPKLRNVAESQSTDSLNIKASRSMDIGSPGKDLGPRLGLKKSSSLESLQTAFADVKKNELPFYRPRPHMVRGRGCNESFRAAIDKSYDGPEGEEEDALSDLSSHSGRESPNSEFVPLGNQETEDTDKSKKEKKKKDAKKEKTKTKGKEKKKKDDGEEQEKKAKKKGFGVLGRLIKKKEEKGNQKQSMLKEEENEVEKMKEERERINIKHQELREQQAKNSYGYNRSHDMEDDDMDPNYAKVNHFQEAPPHHKVHRPYSPPITVPPSYPWESQVLPERENLQDTYAKINKKQQAPDKSDRYLLEALKPHVCGMKGWKDSMHPCPDVVPSSKHCLCLGPLQDIMREIRHITMM